MKRNVNSPDISGSTITLLCRQRVLDISFFILILDNECNKGYREGVW